ncbi:MAG: hypothetical protein AAFQ87_03930 [Bacteroidota bacterium]
MNTENNPLSPIRKLSLLLGFLLLFGLNVQAQEAKKLNVGGYVKFLQTQYFVQNPQLDTTIGLTDNLFHNRLNLHYYPNEKWDIGIESRNRLFYGDQIKVNPAFSDQVDTYNGLVDLSVRWHDGNGFLLHSIIDRAYVNYSHDKWDITVGRQRINWGINTVWNPHDLFNAFNFLDFDYEERPGSDAIRVQYFPGVVSRAEIAIAPDDTIENSVAAALYLFNVKGYDVQVLSGYYRGDAVFGAGWAGNLGQIGFKGEASYFIPIEDLSEDSLSSLNASIGLDYVFGNGLYVSGSALYNSRAEAGSTNALGVSGGALSPKNLFPARFALFASASGNFTPLFTGNVSVIYGPGNSLVALIPTLTYSVKENWAIDFIGQSFFVEQNETFGHQATGVFLRLKWSY